MVQWIGENTGTMIVCIALIALVTGIIIRLHKDKKQGKSSCGYNCECCPMAGSCRRLS